MTRTRLGLCAALLACPLAAHGNTDDRRLPSGQFITPAAISGEVTLPLNPHLARYPDQIAGQAMGQAVGPDGKTLLVLTSGFNSITDPATGKLDRGASSEFIFVYDISRGRPKETQVLTLPTANAGIAFSADGRTFFAGSGGGDSVYAFGRTGGVWARSGAPMRLGHTSGVGVKQGPSTAGLAVSGGRILVVNEFNDSVSLIDVATHAVTGELDLRPGLERAADRGRPGGETPFGVAVSGAKAYISSERDREIDVLDISGATPVLIHRVAVKGTPSRMLLDRQRLFVAADNDDSVQVIDTATDTLVARVLVAKPAGRAGSARGASRYRGAAPNDLALSGDGRSLYVSLGGENAVAVVDVSHRPYRTLGLIPTGWYPNAISAANGWLYVANSRSDPGPNPGNCNFFASHDTGRAAYDVTCRANQYVLQREGASLQASPVPARAALVALTKQVERNDGLAGEATAHDALVMASLRRRIHHVIYVIKENRTYDQILGDLGRGNSDPAIVEFGLAVTPNFHALATQFVDLDDFEDSSEVSGNGWQWDLQGRETDFNAKTIPLEYSRRKTNAPYDSEGAVRGVDVGLASLAERMHADPSYPDDPDLLPGTNSDDIADGPRDDDEASTQTGLLWYSAERRGLTVRNYGVEVSNIGRADDTDAHAARDPQAVCRAPGLMGETDVFFRGFDQNQPDYIRYTEWRREFASFEASGALPSLELVRLSHDHMGKFATALDGVNTPELQQADDDYAVGLLVQDVANSRFADSTLIFVIEDDAQDGPDHVDAHRSTAYVIGPYVKHGAVVSQRYTTVSMLRTIEDVLGIDHLSLFDADQRPMTDIFDLSQPTWRFTAAPSLYLYATTLPLPARHAQSGPVPISTHPASWWAAATTGYDWSREDRVPTASFNALLWRGLKSGPVSSIIR